MADWYKRYPTDFLMGTMGLTLEQKGAYSVILDLIYEKNNPIPDNDTWLAGYLGVSARKWRSIKNDLLDAGKIFVENGKISNVRASFELENRANLSRVRRECGRLGGEAKANTLKTKEVGLANGKQLVSLDKIRGDKKDNPPISPPKGTRAKQLGDWRPGKEDEDRALAFWREKGREDISVAEQIEAFTDHHLAKGSKMKDWSRAWGTWYRNAIQFQRRTERCTKSILDEMFAE